MLYFCLKFSNEQLKSSEVELLWTRLLERPCEEAGLLFFEIHRAQGDFS